MESVLWIDGFTRKSHLIIFTLVTRNVIAVAGLLVGTKRNFLRYVPAIFKRVVMSIRLGPNSGAVSTPNLTCSAPTEYSDSKSNDSLGSNILRDISGGWFTAPGKKKIS